MHGFPDSIFAGKITPIPGFEIKTWFPLATEITARFKDTQNYFKSDNIIYMLFCYLGFPAI